MFSVPLSLTLTLLRLILFILSAVDHKVTQSLTLTNPFSFSGFGNPDYHDRGGDSCSHLHFDSCPFRYLLCQRNTSQQARGKRIVSKLNTKTDWSYEIVAAYAFVTDCMVSFHAL